MPPGEPKCDVVRSPRRNQVCQDFSVRGYWAILQAPKYLVNAVIVHLLARALRWHIDRMLGRSFLHEDEVRGHRKSPWNGRNCGEQETANSQALLTDKSNMK